MSLSMAGNHNRLNRRVHATMYNNVLVKWLYSSSNSILGTFYGVRQRQRDHLKLQHLDEHRVNDIIMLGAQHPQETFISVPVSDQICVSQLLVQIYSKCISFKNIQRITIGGEYNFYDYREYQVFLIYNIFNSVELVHY
jgi:hypothetical protein